MWMSCFTSQSFWRGMGWLGSSPLGRQILHRKTELVYIHWSVLLVFLVMTLMSLGILVRRRAELRRIMRPWAVICLTLYCLLVGLFFFNRPFFSHAMFSWPARMFILSMLRSVIAAVVPVWFLYVVGACDPEMSKVRTRVYLAMIPVLHSVMAVIYLANPHVAVE